MSNDKIDLLQGTLDLLILRTLAAGAVHGHGIAKAIERNSDEVLGVPHGSLYPALHRLERKGWISSEWQKSEKGRDMKYYRLSASGRKQLLNEQSRWEQMSRAINRVLRPA